jgi:hypothetical protein
MLLGALQWTWSKLWGKIIKDNYVSIKAIYIYIYCIKENVIDSRGIHLQGLSILRDFFSMNHTHWCCYCRYWLWVEPSGIYIHPHGD